ncbi:MAG: FtsX-like permease family protein, partial [Longimicrobiales bacterium]
ARPGGETAVQQAIRAAVRARDPLLPVTILDSMTGQMGAALLPQRVSGMLVGAFKLLALLPAAIGVYGVTSVLVAHRVPEIGLRMALGARSIDVFSLVVRHTPLVAGIGAVAGLLLSSLATRTAQSLLFGVSRFDGLTLLLATITVAGASALAAYLPARRATRVDPIVALKA